eukprot:CAMPEP_0118860316 /NCGR_PEP_ID=MMETSP1163-20130328/6207_1 /TAXON_ID=124430 /ORGANISM="Phaeomonas parva, Strain CCMP2877" /LENGTH=173 /DNA_ID=CAMNT_0006793993 /DNA_START=144 /DNA_END=662 /DNA_ORIENTATION=+
MRGAVVLALLALLVPSCGGARWRRRWARALKVRGGSNDGTPLPEGWAQYFTEDGQAYYYQLATGVTQWEPPVSTAVDTSGGGWQQPGVDPTPSPDPNANANPNPDPSADPNPNPNPNPNAAWDQQPQWQQQQQQQQQQPPQAWDQQPQAWDQTQAWDPNPNPNPDPNPTPNPE